MNLNEVIDYIKTLDKHDLDLVIEATNYRAAVNRELENLNIRAKLVIGTRVSFESRRGMTVKGKIIQVNRATAKLLSDEGVKWQVSLSLLKVEA